MDIREIASKIAKRATRGSHRLNPDQLRTLAGELCTRAARLTAEANRAADLAPGVYITGASGRSASQDKKTARALDKTINNAIISNALHAEAVRLDRLADYIESAPAREAEKAERKSEEKRFKALCAKLPIINEPTAHPMTSEEWAKKPADYKSIVSTPAYRYRSAMCLVDGHTTLTPIYLTDKPIKLRPSIQL